jgi:hypothetical protein
MEYVMKKRPYIYTAKLCIFKMFVEYLILYILSNAMSIFYSSESKGNCGIVPLLCEVGSCGGRRTARDGNMADVKVTCTNGVHR